MFISFKFNLLIFNVVDTCEGLVNGEKLGEGQLQQKDILKQKEEVLNLIINVSVGKLSRLWPII